MRMPRSTDTCEGQGAFSRAMLLKVGAAGSSCRNWQERFWNFRSKWNRELLSVTSNHRKTWFDFIRFFFYFTEIENVIKNNKT